MSEEPVVKITLETIYNRVVAVEAQVADLNRTLPTHVSMTKNKQDEYDERLQNHGNRLETLDKRVTEQDTAIKLMQSKERPPAPWYSIVGGIVSIITGLGSLLALLAVLSKLATL